MASSNSRSSDKVLGHLIVLLQYDWPKEEEMFAQVLTMIQRRRKFHYPECFNYIISILLLIVTNIINTLLIVTSAFS